MTVARNPISRSVGRSPNLAAAEPLRLVRVTHAHPPLLAPRCPRIIQSAHAPSNTPHSSLFFLLGLPPVLHSTSYNFIFVSVFALWPSYSFRDPVVRFLGRSLVSNTFSLSLVQVPPVLHACRSLASRLGSPVADDSAL